MYAVENGDDAYLLRRKSHSRPAPTLLPLLCPYSPNQPGDIRYRKSFREPYPQRSLLITSFGVAPLDGTWVNLHSIALTPWPVYVNRTFLPSH